MRKNSDGTYYGIKKRLFNRKASWLGLTPLKKKAVWSVSTPPEKGLNL